VDTSGALRHHIRSLPMKKPHKKVTTLARAYRVTRGDDFALKDFATDDTGKLESGADSDDLLAHGVNLLSDLQERGRCC
jgi:hypothetical protein